MSGPEKAHSKRSARRPLRAPNIKPFFHLGFGDVEGRAIIAHHCERSRKDGRDLREAFGAHPSVVHYVGICLHRNPVPRHIPFINAKGSRENRSAPTRRQGVFQGNQVEREIFLGIR